MKSAIVLCSGGLDSVTTAFYVKKKLSYDKIILLFFDYGQRAMNAERKFSRNCARKIGAEFFEIKLKELGGMSSAQINSKNEHNKISREDLGDTSEESVNWYVPCRNLIFVSYAIAFAESLVVKEKVRSDIFVGFKNEGLENYPDTTKEFVDSLEKVSSCSTLGKPRIKAPMIKKDKEDIINLALKLGVDLEETFSCYVGPKKHCGTCLACRLRQEGFRWAGAEDVTDYKD